MLRSQLENNHIIWNPWHGCKKISEGCLNCYMYSADLSRGIDPTFIHKTRNFFLPIEMGRDCMYKIPSHSLVRTNLTSDTFLDEASEWIDEFWGIIRGRKDCLFSIITKRPENIARFIPDDWDSFNNVEIMITCENQANVEKRIKYVEGVSIKHLSLCIAPILERVDLTCWFEKYDIDYVSISGERANNARLCDFKWILDIRDQCIEYDVNCIFFETGSRFMFDGKVYNIVKKSVQEEQAKKSGIDYICTDVYYYLGG